MGYALRGFKFSVQHQSEIFCDFGKLRSRADYFVLGMCTGANCTRCNSKSSFFCAVMVKVSAYQLRGIASLT